MPRETGAHGGLRRILQPWCCGYRWSWTADCERWELNSGPLEERSALCTAESSLQPLAFGLQQCVLAIVEEWYPFTITQRLSPLPSQYIVLYKERRE